MNIERMEVRTVRHIDNAIFELEQAGEFLEDMVATSFSHTASDLSVEVSQAVVAISELNLKISQFFNGTIPN